VQCIVIGPVCGFVTAGGRADTEPYYTQCARNVCVSLSTFSIEECYSSDGRTGRKKNVINLLLILYHRLRNDLYCVEWDVEP